jgi:NAD(P)-dependent dehydrogenase (short-subunit alcohol dehydrogenase family)
MLIFPQGGKTYNKWVGYGQSKTANMLMALSLAKKLGVKYGVEAYSLHPGQIMTNLGSHLDWNVDMQDLCKLLHCAHYRVITHSI